MTNQQPLVTGLVTLDLFTIKGRGVVHSVELPDSFINKTDSRTLTGSLVELDGKIVKVRGVETHAILWRPGIPSVHKKVGLLV